jgi:hypothetical protein
MVLLSDEVGEVEPEKTIRVTSHATGPKKNSLNILSVQL